MERTGKRYRDHLMALLSTGVLVLATACPVKEDRAPCPCILDIDFACPESPGAGNVGLIVESPDGIVWRDTVDVIRSGQGYQVPVPRARLHVRAWTGEDVHASDLGILIPLGQDCPRVYMHDSDVRTDGEYFHEDIILRKNHCVMTLLTEGEGRISSSLTLKGNVAGYDALGRPVQGDFEFLLDDGGLEEGYVAVLPRQADASLMLEIDDGKGNHKAFALGRYIVSSGYDWSAPDLDDVTVTIDYALTEIRLVVSGWESVYRYDVEI